MIDTLKAYAPITSGFVAVICFLLAYNGVWLGGYVIAGFISFCLFMWMMIEGARQDEEDRVAWEKTYAAMSDSQKIEHHLRRARQLGSNYDANIAQALIERNKK